MHEHPVCCNFKCWCIQILPEGLIRLEDLKLESQFECPWNGKTFKLLSLTPSAAWIEVWEDVEFEVKNKKTGEIKTVKTRKKVNQPWSRRTVVKPLGGNNGQERS